MGKIEDQTEDVLPENAERGSKENLNRASRNESAKDRSSRDKANAFINELATLVPGCSPQSNKLDKANKAIILENTVDFIKVHNDLTVTITCKDTTPSLQNNKVGQLMFEGYNAFVFVISLSGTFKFLSECVYDLLGYKKGDLIGKNVLDYIHPEDKLILMRELSEHSRTGIARNSGSSLFYIRFKAKVDGKPFYDTLRCCGYFSPVKEEVESTNDGHTVLSSNETCFVALAKLIQPNYQRDVSNWLNIAVEFTSRQNLDGKFVYLDERCTPITGYLPNEILGSMLYEFIHFDDLENIRTSFEALFEDGEAETGDYHILTKGCQWILIRTKSYIFYNHWNYKPEYICSTHQLVRTNTDVGSSVHMGEISSAAGSETKA